MISGQRADGTTYSSTVPCSSNFDTVPSIIGTSLPTATAQLNAHGLRGVVSYQRSTSVFTGQVMGVIPTSGTKVPPGSRLSVVVSLGPNGKAPESALQPGLVVIPNVAGLTKDAAT
jgi:beta-lactam-binding protein with PASTA domain